jgi:phage gpG-like protein
MITLQITVSTSALQATLEALQDFIEPSNIANEAGAMLLNRIRTRFLQEKDPDGAAWAPSQAAIDRRRKGGTGTLFDTGRLWRSIQFAQVPVFGTKVIASDVPYGKYHQFGIGQVRRVFLGVGVADGVLIERLLERRLQQILAKGAP